MITIQFVKEVKNYPVRVIATQNETVKTNILTTAEKKTVAEAVKQAHFTAKEGQFVDILGGTGKVIVAGIGDKPSEKTFCDLGGRLSTKLSKDTEITYYATGTHGVDEVQEAVQVAYGALLGAYRFPCKQTHIPPDDTRQVVALSSSAFQRHYQARKTVLRFLQRCAFALGGAG
jgi:leucyl aminopeptidase